MSTTPIADLSYRNYDGGLESPRLRWWVVARMMIRLALKKKILWVAMAFSGWYYLGMIFVLFVVDQMSQAAEGGGGMGVDPASEFLNRIVWKDQFLHGFSFGQLLFLIIALILGAGAIANDNRANALLVYLSKPVSKLDYLLGKWMGVFLPLLIVMLVPTLIFFAYGALSYAGHGFLSDDPLLFPKLLIMLPIAAAFHASLIVGISSMFNQGRLAGATYAGLYFLTNFFTQLMSVTWATMTGPRVQGEAPPALLDAIKPLYYASIDGLNIGMAKGVLGTNGTPYFGIPSRIQSVPMPPLLPVLAIMFGLSFISMFIAWRRIRAVEVVG
jgi:ABC-2 type transport system permease protein